MANATIVMKLQGPGGPIEGDCTVEGYEGFIDLESWDWSLTYKDKLVPSGISFSKMSDRATIPMLELLQRCKEAPSAVILIEEDSADSDFEVKLTLTQVRFLTYSLTGEVDEKRGTMTENWTARPDKMRIDYRRHAGLASIPFEIEFDPRAQAKSPNELAEDEILEISPKLRPEGLQSLFKRMTDAVNARQRKRDREPPGAKPE